MGKVRLCILLLLLLVPLTVVGPAHAGPRVVTRDRATAATGLHCSTQGMPLAVQSVDAEAGTTCVRARELVRAWFVKLKTPGNTCSWVDGSYQPGVCTVRHWRCVNPHTVNGHTDQVTCTRDAGHRRLRFVNRV